MSAGLVDLLMRAVARAPGAGALRLDDVTMSYGALLDGASRVGALLAERGVRPGDRVLLMMPNVPEFALGYYGILLAGGVVVPLNPLLRPREIDHCVGDSGAQIALVWESVELDLPMPAVVRVGPEWVPGSGLLQTPPARCGSATAVILYTSGTTGVPKGAELTHDNLRRNAEAFADLFSIAADDVTLGALPLFHSFGQTCALNAATAAGACLTLLARFEAGRALEIVERDRVTIFEGVPTMYGAMLHHPAATGADTSSLRLCASGGAAMPLELMRAFEDAFGATILEGYGLSETSPVASFNRSARARKAGSIGTPIEGVEMKVVDDEGRDLPVGEVGEIVIRGHNVMKGYWGRADATVEVMRGGWFHTGDMARVDGDGYFFIVDRKKDLIIRGGYNVYPREVEEVLYEHPAVREAAVVGVPDERLGEEVAAVVALADGCTASVEELRAFVRERVAPYKYPRQVWLVDEVPKGPTGKILRRAVRDRFPIS